MTCHINMNKIEIAQSDYTRQEIESGIKDTYIGNDQYLLNEILLYESKGYKISFKTSLCQKLFGLGKYKIIATKK